MCFGIIYKSAHGPGVMFFRIIVQPVRVLLVATDKNTVIHYPLCQPLRVPVRRLIQLCPASPRPLLLTPVQPHCFQQAAHLLADEVAGNDVARIPHKDHVAVRPHHFVPQVDIVAAQHHGHSLCDKTAVPVIRGAGNVQPAALGNITGVE